MAGSHAMRYWKKFHAEQCNGGSELSFSWDKNSPTFDDIFGTASWWTGAWFLIWIFLHDINYRQAADVNLSPAYLPRIYSLSTPPCHPTENAKISMTSRTNKFCLGYKHRAQPIKGVKSPFFLWERSELLDFRAWAVEAGPKQSLSSSCIV